MDYMAYKRKRSTTTPRYQRLARPTKKAKKTRFAGKAGIQRVVSKMLNRKLETKESTSTIADGTGIIHNSFVTLDPASTAMKIFIGTNDVMGATGERIGDEVNLKGISYKMMIQNNQRFNNITYRLMLVRSAKGDVPTKANLFCGKSGNKMIDGINKERYSIIAQKYFKINANPSATNAGLISSLGVEYGVYTMSGDAVLFSPPTRLVSLWVPGAKIAKGGLLKYENGSSTQLKFFDYTLVLYAYANLSTSEVVEVALVNDFTKTMYYTDA